MTSHRREAVALFLGMRSWECPASLAKNESVHESESNLAGKFCVNATAAISRTKLNKNMPMFLQSSRFVRGKRIVPRIGIDRGETIFR
jgi:hypothetical protein